jgi:hypothetical protein
MTLTLLFIQEPNVKHKLDVSIKNIHELRLSAS